MSLIHPLHLFGLLGSFSSGDNSEQGQELIARMFPLAVAGEHILSVTTQRCTFESCCIYCWKISCNCPSTTPFWVGFKKQGTVGHSPLLIPAVEGK